MNYHESFHIIFSYKNRIYLGKVNVSHLPGLYYFSILLDNQRKLFFVDDEQDQWIENNEGNTLLADQIGGAIDRHYHPDHFQDNPPINPDESTFFH
ncbi:MAG TPA: hypothetical protein VF974_01685 [Patescibacteria group bacterium]